MSLVIQVLGRVSVTHIGRSYHVRPAKARALLAVLALNANRPVPLRIATAAVWAGVPPQSAIANLRTYASNLRVLVGDRLTTDNGSYRLRVERGELDADVFLARASRGRIHLNDGNCRAAADELDEALALWHGLPGDDLPAGTALEAHFASLEEARMATFEDWVEARLRLGEYTPMLSQIRLHLQEHPLRERAWRQLMLARYKAGDIAGALLAYAEARSALAEQLGVEPGRDLARLQRAILDRTPDPEFAR